MMKISVYIIIGLLSVFILQSCNVSKFIADDKKLYTGSDITFENDKDIYQKKNLKNNIVKELYPKPNKKFLGLFYTKLWLNLKIKTNKTKGFKYWLKNKVGEEPVYLSDVDIKLMESVVDKTMQDFGYFNTSTSSEIKIKKKHIAKILYHVNHSQQTIIDTIVYPYTDTDIDSIISNNKNLLTKSGDAYNLDKLEKDRASLAKEIRSLGYFEFDISDLFYVVDTSVGDYKVNLHYKVKQSDKEKKLKKYYINTINVYPTYQSNKAGSLKENFTGSFYFKGLAFRQDYNFVGKRALYNNILLEIGDLFSVKDYEYTSERLNNLNVFNFVNINYHKNEQDSLTVDVLLTPGKHQGFRADIEASTSNRSFLGSSFSVSYDNRNIFKGAEKFRIKASVGTEFQMIDKKAAMNILDFNFEMSLDLPRLLFTKRSPKIYSNKIPTTSYIIKEKFQQWLQYYTLNSLNFTYKYDWRNEKRHHHTFQPLFVNLISLLKTTHKFDDLVDKNPLLRTSFSNSVIIGRNYSFSASTQRSSYDRHYIYFSGLIENAGNESYIISNIFNKDKPKPHKIFNTPFSQYSKFDIDFRYYFKPSPFSIFIARLNPGIGVPYGNSEVLPYIKQFYMGGPNTLRAFQFRSVGPGRFTSKSDSTDLNPIEQSGDIKLMLNLEYRFDIYKFLKGALFADMGNVWLLKNDPNREDSQFKGKSFYKEIAIGSGFGIRLDFNFFVLRADIGIPVYVPYYPDDSRWISNFPERKFGPWIRKNMVFNIAIGYPF